MFIISQDRWIWLSLECQMLHGIIIFKSLRVEYLWLYDSDWHRMLKKQQTCWHSNFKFKGPSKQSFINTWQPIQKWAKRHLNNVIDGNDIIEYLYHITCIMFAGKYFYVCPTCVAKYMWNNTWCIICDMNINCSITQNVRILIWDIFAHL